MRDFFRDRKGAVTVFTTLLLIPALIVSGTAVDLARIFTAKSIVQDANQLAANSVLASYDAMLQDLYGLFGVMKDDEILAGMLDEYVETVVYGEDWQDRTAGTFQIFYGSDIEPVTVTPASNQNLRNPHVLRRQIEEYVKFRAPAIIVDELLARVEQFVKIKNDAEAIKEKLEIDDEFSEIVDLYEEYYLRLRFNDYYLYTDHRDELEIRIYDEINRTMKEIRTSFGAMYVNYNEYIAKKAEIDAINEQLAGKLTATQRKTLEEQRDGLIRARDEAEENYNDMQTHIYMDARALSDKLDSYKNRHCPIFNSDYYEETAGICLEAYNHNVDKLCGLARSIDKKAEDIRKKISDLRAKLPKCSEELRGTEASPGIGASLDDYESLLAYRLTVLTDPLRGNEAYIEGLKNQLNASAILYGKIRDDNGVADANAMTLSALSSSNIFYGFIETANADRLRIFAEYSEADIKYNYFHDATNLTMKRFAGLSDAHTDLYASLALLYQSASDDDNYKKDKKAIQKAMDKMVSSANAKLRGVTNDVRGHESIPAAAASRLAYEASGDANDSLNNSDWNNAGHNGKAAQKSLGDASKKFLDMGSLLNAAGNKILLLTYDSETFSNYATQYKKDAKSLTGVLFEPNVNYLLDSEHEYLFHGSSDVKENLNAVTGLLFMTRFVFNYISTFKIPSVKATLTGIQAAFAWSGPFALVARELARVAFAVGESALDVIYLRSGEEVPLIKMEEDQWKLGVGAIISIAEDIAQSLINSAVSSLKEAALSQIAGLRAQWGAVSGDVKDKLNTAEKIEEFIGDGSRGSASVSELKNGFESFSGSINATLNHAESEVKATQPPQIRKEEPQSVNEDDIRNGNINLDPELKLNYTDYMRIFLLFIDGDTLGNRTANLISLNVSTAKEGYDVDSGKLFPMNEAFTDFSVTTTVEMRMIFLSMPFAQKGVNGVTPPKTLPITATDYRGY